MPLKNNKKITEKLAQFIITIFILSLSSYPTFSETYDFDSTEICNLFKNIEPSVSSKKNNAFLEFSLTNNRSAKIIFRPKMDNWRLAIVEIKETNSEANLQLRLSPPCKLLGGRRLYKDLAGDPYISVFDKNFHEVSREAQNPPFILKKNIKTPTEAPFLALVDTGVNYLLPYFQDSLALNKQGDLIGYDFWDNDKRPYDKDPRRNPFFPMHHGSTIFSVLKAETDGVTIAVYRFPATNLCRFKALINHAADLGIRIINMSMGSNDPDDWDCFFEVAVQHPKILFVVSAGNDNVNIDNSPVYPASLPINNMLVVTSSDAFGRLASQSNFGKKNVDLMVPAEQLEVVDHRGVRVTTGGSSYAAPRVSALAARFLQSNQNTNTKDLIKFLVSRAIPSSANKTKFGWIPDPTDNFGFNSQKHRQ